VVNLSLRVFLVYLVFDVLTRILRKVNAKVLSALIVSAGLIFLSTAATAQSLYRWVDKDGVVHYGDHIPPEYANNDRQILNQHGITVGFEEGEITPEEQAELDRIAAEEEQRDRDHQAAVARDQMLLATYLSVADIEGLRDRRIALLESQITVTELYLTNLRKHLESTQLLVARFEAQETPVPENLRLELEQTTESIDVYQTQLVATREQQQALRVEFDADIERFAELKQGKR